MPMFYKDEDGNRKEVGLIKPDEKSLTPEPTGSKIDVKAAPKTKTNKKEEVNDDT